MHAFFYMISCSILLLIAETLLRSIGLTLPLLGLFFAAAAFIVSARMTLAFALVFGIMLDFAMGHASPWSGLLLPLLALPAIFLHGKRPAYGVFEFLIGAMTPLVMAVPHFRAVFASPDMFASLLMSCLFCAFLFPLFLDLVLRSSLRLKIGAGADRNGGA